MAGDVSPVAMFFQMTFTDENLGANVAGYIFGIVNFLMTRQGAMVVEGF